MPITFQNASGNSLANGGGTIAFDVGTGPTRVLFAFVRVASSELARIQTPTYNGVAMTLIDSQNNTPDNQWAWAVYYLLNPTSGSNTFSVTISPATSQVPQVLLSCYNGVLPSNQFDAEAQYAQNAGPTTFSMPITVTVPGAWVVGFTSHNSAGNGPNTSSFRAAAGSPGGVAIDSAGDLQPGATSLNVTLATTGQGITGVVMSVKPVTTGAPLAFFV